MRVNLLIILLVSCSIFTIKGIIVLQKTEVPDDDSTLAASIQQSDSRDTNSKDSTVVGTSSSMDMYYYDENQDVTTQSSLDSQTCTLSTCNYQSKNQKIDSNVPKNIISSSITGLDQSDGLLPHSMGERQTVVGTMCAATYVFEGQTYDDCFVAPNGKEYCKTDVGIVRECQPLPTPPAPEPEQETEKKTQFQPAPEPETGLVRYTVTGKICKFPMVYKGTVYNDCIDTQKNGLACFVDGKWEKCRPININRYLTDGRRCEFPFIYNDLQQYDCVIMPDEKDYCKIDGAWQQCVPLVEEKNQKISENSFERLNNLVNDPQNEQEIQGFQGSDDKSNNNSTVVVVLILLVVVMVGIVSVAVFILRKRKNSDNQQNS